LRHTRSKVKKKIIKALPPVNLISAFRGNPRSDHPSDSVL